MTTLSWVPRMNISKTISVVPTLTASAAYVSGDQLGSIMALTDVVRQDNQVGFGNCKLLSVSVLDADSQNAAMDIWFFNTSPTLSGANHAAFNMSDANQAAQCIGIVSVGAAYSASSSNSITTTVNINLPLQVAGTATVPNNVYAVAIVRGTPTYSAVSSLKFQFSVQID